MNNIVKSEIAVASWQGEANAAGVIIAVVLLAVLGGFAAVNTSSTISAVIAALVGLTAVLFAHAAYAIRNEKN